MERGEGRTRSATSWPTDHHMDMTVRRYWCEAGMKSRNTAESTGRFPPTPRPSTASRDASVMKFGDPPAARPKTPARKRVMLNDHLRMHTERI